MQEKIREPNRGYCDRRLNDARLYGKDEWTRIKTLLAILVAALSVFGRAVPLFAQRGCH